MKEKLNPLAGLVEAMKDHDKRMAQPIPAAKPEMPSPIQTTRTKMEVPVQTVTAVEKPRLAGDKVFCGARYTRGQIRKMDKIIFLTHKERGVRLTQSDILKQALERMPIAPLEPGEVDEIMAANRRKQLNSQTV